MHITDRPLRYQAANAMVIVLASLTLTGAAQAAPQTTPIVPEPPPVREPTVAPMPDFESCEKPDYPKSSLRNDETGMVTMSFLIGADGIVKDTQLNKSSGFPALDESAMSALAKCRFKPAIRDGRVIESWIRIEYVWALEK